jgi:predicted GTPase
MKLVTAQDRIAENRGVSVLVIGPTGVGKTSLMGTLSRETLGRVSCTSIPKRATFRSRISSSTASASRPGATL